MSLLESDIIALNAFYDYNRIPLWVLDNNRNFIHTTIAPVTATLSDRLHTHMKQISGLLMPSQFDILCYENEIYYQFTFHRENNCYYLLGGPILLSVCYHIIELCSLSFASLFSSSELRTLTDILPVLSFTEFSASLRLNMLTLTGTTLSPDEVRNFKIDTIAQNFNHAVIREQLEVPTDSRAHTPYRDEVAILECIKAGDLIKLQSIYQALPRVKYGKMSNNPLRQFFYGCIANTTLVTRYAIEGGLDEEKAYTLSDLYIQQMENCRTLYELSTLNEKMAVDFTKRVAKAKSAIHTTYIKPISNCISYIEKNINTKLTLSELASFVNLTPKYLSSLFKSEAGQTLSSFIEEKRIEKAKELLQYSNYTYSYISHFLMFNSQSYFIVVFKKRVGMTPKEYREKYH